MGRKRYIKFTPFDFNCWDKPRHLKDVLVSTFVDNPFGFYFNLGWLNFSIGFTVFGLGAGFGFNSPFYAYVKLEGLGFDIDIAAGFYRDYEREYTENEPPSLGVEKPLTGFGIDIDALQAEVREERAAATVALSTAGDLTVTRAVLCCTHGDDDSCDPECETCASDCPVDAAVIRALEAIAHDDVDDIADDDNPQYVTATVGEVHAGEVDSEGRIVTTPTHTHPEVMRRGSLVPVAGCPACP